MGKVVEFKKKRDKRKPRMAWSRSTASDQRAARATARPQARKGRGYRTPEGVRKTNNSRWFVLAMIAVPLGAFSAVFFAPSMGGGVEEANAAVTSDLEEAYFPICGDGPRITCVVDGDTIWYQGAKIRIADINTPEVSEPGCAAEARLGRRATRRMQYLLNEGAFTVAPNPDGREEDRYGRKLRVIERGGASLGGTLVDEGLAEEWNGVRRGWC